MSMKILGFEGLVCANIFFQGLRAFFMAEKPHNIKMETYNRTKYSSFKNSVPKQSCSRLASFL